MEKNESEKTLEMRVAELEDRVKGLQVSEEEMRAFQKVAALMGLTTGAQPAAAAGIAEPRAAAGAMIPAPDSCIVNQCIRPCTVVSQCIRACTIVRTCTIVQQCTIVRSCTIIQDCINECGGGLPGGGTLGGGFGTLGG